MELTTDNLISATIRKDAGLLGEDIDLTYAGYRDDVAIGDDVTFSCDGWWHGPCSCGTNWSVFVKTKTKIERNSICLVDNIHLFDCSGNDTTTPYW